MSTEALRARNSADALRGFVAALMDVSRKKALFFDADRALEVVCIDGSERDPSDVAVLLRDLASVNDGAVALYSTRSATAMRTRIADLSDLIVPRLADISLLAAAEPHTLMALMRTPRFAERVPFFFVGAPVDRDLADVIHRHGGRVAEISSVASPTADVTLSSPIDVSWLIRDLIAQNGGVHPSDPSKGE